MLTCFTQALNRLIDELAEKYRAGSNAIAVAWSLRRSAKIQAIAGSANPRRIAGIARAAGVTPAREERYALYMAAGKRLP